MQASIPVGTLVGGRWEIAGVLGEGGFGQVLLAVDTSEVALGEAAVKVLHPNTTPQERADFLTEVKKIATLRHPNLVGYLDSGQIRLEPDGETRHETEVRPFLVTERCALSLSDHGRRSTTGRLGAAETLSVLADVTAGLAHLHQQGLIHRDIKPGNVLWADGRWKLADFGLMRDLSATGSYHRAGTLIGTPLFMAPELFSDMVATPASDIYAMGVLAHVCATGRHVHTGAGPILVHNVATQPPTIDPSLPPVLHAIVSRCTHPDPVLRPTAAELVDLVAAAQRGEVAYSPAAAAPTQVDPGFIPAPISTPTPASGQPWASPYGPAPAPSGPTGHPAQPLASPYAGYPAPTSGPAPASPYAAPSPAPAVGTSPYGAPAASGPGVAPAPASWPYGSPGQQVGGPAGSWAPPVAVPVDGPAPRPRAVVLALGSVAGLVLVGVLGAGLWALTSGKDPGTTATGSSTTVSGGVTGTQAGGGTAGVQIGDNVTIGPNVQIGSGTPLRGANDATDHLVTPACPGDSPPTVVQVVNKTDAPVTYDIHSYQFDQAGVRIGEAYDSVVGVAPGQGAWLNVAGTVEGVARCELDTLTFQQLPAATTADGANVAIQSCELDTFLGNYYDIAFTVTNPGTAAADATITFSVVDADGVIIDQSFERTVYDIAPGGTVKDATGDFYSNIDISPEPGDHCIVSAVRFETP